MINGTFVNFDIGNACNLRCKFCYNDGRRNIRQYFEDFDVLKNRAENLRKKTDSINLIGGEPLMYPRLLELLKILEKLDFNISIVTNGLGFIKDDLFNKIFKYKKLKKITLSIHSISDNNNFKISQRKNIEEKREKIVEKLLILKKQGKINLSITTVINKYNYSEIIELFKKYRDLGIDSFGFSGIILQKESTQSNLEVSLDYIQYINKIKELNNIIVGEKVIIHWLPLCVHFQVGNKLNYTIRELNNKFFKSLQKQGKNLLKSHLENKKILNECKKCSAFLKFCNGVYKDYYQKYENNGLQNIKKKELIKFLKNNI